MLEHRSAPARLIGLVLAVATLVAAVPVVVHHHADHLDEAVHLEHAHGGHGGILEQDDARIPAPPGAAVPSLARHPMPDARRIRSTALPEESFAQPPCRAPPPDLPRAPPTRS